MPKKIAGLVFLFLSLSPAFAYIDPGLGGAIASGIGPIIGAILAIISGFLIMRIFRPARRVFSETWSRIKGFLGSNKKRAAAIIFVALVLVVLVVMDMPGEKSAGDGKKVLVIGIDALEPKIVERLWEEGKMQNFRKLSEEGDFSRLQVTIPPETPVSWSAAATGLNPGGYGLFDFINRNPKTYLPKLNLARAKEGALGISYESALGGTPFWRITSNAGIATTVIRWPVSFPPEKIEGNMLSGLGVVDLKGLLSSYRFYTSGDFDEKSEGAEKVVPVEFVGGKSETFISGPMKREVGELVEVRTPMEIKLADGKILLEFNGKSHELQERGWSKWMRAKFDAGFLNEVYGIFKVYVLSTEPEFSMYMTTVQIDPENPALGISYPKEFSSELAKDIGLYYTLGMPEETKGVTENRIPKEVLLEQIQEIEEERTKMFWHEFEGFDGGVFAFGFDSGDRLQHIFWEEGEIPGEIEQYYLEKDRFLGELLGKIDDNTLLIIFSDHGFSSFERAVSVNTWLYNNGYLALTKEPTEEDAGELFRYVDWGKTKAYSLGFNSIYINLKGREAKGIVKQGERDVLVNEISGELGEWKDPKTGQSVMAAVYRGDKIYSGKFVEDAPDIVVGTNEGYRLSWQNAVGGFTPEEVFDNGGKWVGEHLMDRSFVPGVLFTNFKIGHENPDIMDIAPTVLDGLAIEIPEEMEGESLLG